MSTESVGSCSCASSSSFLQPRRLFQDEPDHNPQTTPLEMNPPFSSPPHQEGHFRNTVSDCLTPPSAAAAVSIPSDRTVFPMSIPQNAPGVVNYPHLSPQGQYGNFTMNSQMYQPTPVRNPQITPEAANGPYTPEGYNGNKFLASGAGGSGPPDRQAIMMTNGEDLPKIQCPCGSGTCIVLTAHTVKNPNRRFYKCEKCNFFKWCDELNQSSRSPLKPSQVRSPYKISPKNSPSKPERPICSCKAGECIIRTMHQGENKGHMYYACAIKQGQGACKHFEWVDSPVKPPEAENDSNENQNNPYIVNANQNNPCIVTVTTPELKETRPPYESVKDLFSENDMRNIDFWSQGQNAPNCVGETIVNVARRELSPGKRPPQPNTVGEISPMKRLNLSDASLVVGNCPTCGGIGQCVECPVLTCFKDDDFAEEKHGNALDGYTIANMANVPPVGGNTVDNTNTGCLRRVGKCFNCGEEGHWSSECTSSRGTNSACSKCGKLGHWMNNCNM